MKRLKVILVTICLGALMIGGCGKAAKENVQPTETPQITQAPTPSPTIAPTKAPTPEPTATPEPTPTVEPTPTAEPTPDPTKFNMRALEKLGFSIEKLDVPMDGVEGEYNFIFISDLHIIMDTEATADERVEEVKQRVETFRQPGGNTSAEIWLKIAEKIDSCNADAILLGGDMVDFACAENVERLKEGLRMIKTPVLYIGADHDFQPFFCDGVNPDEIPSFYSEFNGMQDTPIMEFSEFCVVGFNNSTSQITASAMERFRDVVAKNKPIMLLTHVPFQPEADESLAELSKRVKGDRVLTWGEGCYYDPEEYTNELLNVVFDKNGPVKQVICGHLHHTWDGKLTENTRQHVFWHAASGSIGTITVR